MQLIIVGMHRSGTSMLTRLINLMGAYVGPEHMMVESKNDNPKGYWERTDVFPLNDTILGLRGCTWKVVAGWDHSRSPELPSDLIHTMKSIVFGMDPFRPWVMKDPRLCLTLPCWMPTLEVPVAVLIYRDPLEIVSSLKERGMLPAHSLSLWEYHAVGALNATEKMPRFFVRHDKLIADPVGTLSCLFSELEAQGVTGLRMPSDREINAFVDQKLYRAKANALAFEVALSPAQQALALMLCGKQTQERMLEVSVGSLEVMAQVKAEHGPASAG